MRGGPQPVAAGPGRWAVGDGSRGDSLRAKSGRTGHFLLDSPASAFYKSAAQFSVSTAAPARAIGSRGLGRGPRERNREMALPTLFRSWIDRWLAGPRRTPRRPRLALQFLEGREVPPTGGGFPAGGLLGEYFSNPNLAGPPAFPRRDVRLDFDWQ